MSRCTIQGPAVSGLPTGVAPEGVASKAKIQILKVPGCPNVAEVRALVEEVLGDAGVLADIEELEGPYPSPSVLVDGIDVTGRAAGAQASCRLDLPTRKQVLMALNAPRGNAQGGPR
jgi:hypothetical protein